ncbi:hypothetical protein MMMDOFMJ_4249 [Methylobacterium gnaphalii]|uniref:hypothetical protein n=2 Tax=Methylobacterium gnaphalii TaxID=1010610 RepID=UPI001EE34753|nr:hypothetical protein [Methylobacterium gnaphalii]GJD71294.1 hypothetical protein MMMDOFMJ_4249 [Methylobacterium gnaphalii]
MTRTSRLLAAVAILGAAALGAGDASAKGFGHGHGHGHFGHGHWGGHGHGHGHWGGGWGGLAYAPVYFGGCTLRRYVDVYGALVVRRVCY